MSAKSYYVIAALLLLATIPMYLKILGVSSTVALPPVASDRIGDKSSKGEPSRNYGWTDERGLATKGFTRGRTLPAGYECSSPDGYVVAVKDVAGRKMIEPLMDNGQMLRCIHGAYGGNIR